MKKSERKSDSVTKRLWNGEGLLADAWRTISVGAIWAYELASAAAARGLGGRNALLPSGTAVARATETVAPAQAEAMERDAEPGSPMTLGELGVPRALASELEAVFRLLGTQAGDVVAGYTFVAPDGARHAVRLAPANGPDSPSEAGRDLAA
jgi:hypothetical protein